MDHPTEDFVRDPALGAALRDTYGDAPEIDFAALHGAVMARAELPLARMRRAKRNPWQARFRAFVPLAAAAGVVGTAFALGVTAPGGGEPQLSEADRAQVEQILDASLPDVGELVVGQLSNEQLLNAAAGS